MNMETANTPALLLLNLPPSAFAGIDLLSFTATPRFRGVKDLPRGFHFAFTGTSTAFSERHGIWFHVEGKTGSDGAPLFVTKWNPSTETLETETDEAERLRWRANLGSIWREGLTPYRQTTSKSPIPEDDDSDEEEEINDWPALTSAITPALLSRITAGDSSHWHLTSASSARRDLEDIPGLDPYSKETLQADKELHLLPVNLKQTWPSTFTGRARTEAARDRSWALSNLTPNPTDLIGELQFTFLMVLTLNNFSCLEQWKRILTLIFTCRSIIPEDPDLFISFLATLRLQLQHCKDAESGLIDLSDETQNLLKPLLTRFRSTLESLPGSTAIADVTDELDDLEEFLRLEHNWTFGGDFLRSGVLELEDGEQVEMESTAFDEDDETGEFAPLIVELTAEQARLLDVTPEDARELGLRLEGTRLKDKGVEDVVQESGGEEDDSSSEEEEEEMQDLEEMDARF